MPRVLLLDYSKTTNELKETFNKLLPGPVTIHTDMKVGMTYDYLIVSSSQIIIGGVDVAALKQYKGLYNATVVAVTSDKKLLQNAKVKDTANVCILKDLLLDPKLTKAGLMEMLQQAC